MKIRLTSIGLFTALVLGSYAQAESLVDGNAEAGKTKSITCTACHGAEGNSVNALWPNIAGQGAPYTASQLQAFKDGGRADPVMSSQAMLLSEQDMNDLAVYFESLPAAAQAVSDPSLNSRAEGLYRGGDAENGVAACIACHGPTGAGNPAAGYPAVGGQHAAYTEKQLRDYAAGSRTSDGDTEIMRTIAQRLTPEDITAIASYLQGLH